MEASLALCRNCNLPAVELIPCEDDSYLCEPCAAAALGIAHRAVADTAALDAAVRDAIHGTEIARNEYQAGTVDYTTVATAQATQLTDQQSALNVQQQRLLDSAALIGDLGGGWSGVLHDAQHPDRVQQTAGSTAQ